MGNAEWGMKQREAGRLGSREVEKLKAQRLTGSEVQGSKVKGLELTIEITLNGER
jgi:hypothetical protein